MIYLSFRLNPVQAIARAALIAITLSVAVPAIAEPPNPAPMTQQAQNNRPYLLVFPVIVLGIIGVLLVVKRRK
ncbi:MAG: hypothetical protein ACK4SX_14080 [Alcanivoracaceae bacterium]